MTGLPTFAGRTERSVRELAVEAVAFGARTRIEIRRHLACSGKRVSYQAVHAALKRLVRDAVLVVELGSPRRYELSKAYSYRLRRLLLAVAEPTLRRPVSEDGVVHVPRGLVGRTVLVLDGGPRLLREAVA